MRTKGARAFLITLSHFLIDEFPLLHSFSKIDTIIRYRISDPFKGQGQGWGHFLPTFDSSLAFTPRRHGLRQHLSEWQRVVSRVTRHTASDSRRRACRREAPRPDRLARDKPTNTPHGACQLGEGQAVSSLAFERRLSHSLQLCSRTTRLHACASAPRGSNCGPSHTV